LADVAKIRLCSMGGKRADTVVEAATVTEQNRRVPQLVPAHPWK
jgi:hypothetical protein